MVVIDKATKGTSADLWAGMGRVHDDLWRAWCQNALFVKLISGLVDIGVAVDLHNEREAICVIAQVTALIVHIETHFW